MASPEWLEIYESYTPEALDAEIAALQRQNSVFSSQTVGAKSFTRDLGAVRDKLSSAIRIKNMRAQGNRPNQNWGVTDFSQIRDDADR